LTIYLCKAVLFPKDFSLAGIDPVPMIWVIVSLIAMHRFKIGMISWIAVSAVFGAVVCYIN